MSSAQNLAKLTYINKGERFKKGSLFYPRDALLDSIDKKKAYTAIDKYTKPRIKESMSFNSQVKVNMDLFETRTNSMSIDSAHSKSPNRIRERSKIFKYYRDLKADGGDVPVLEKVNAIDYLPNSVKKHLK